MLGTLLVLGVLWGQLQTPPPVGVVVADVIRNVRENLERVPSISAEEAIESSRGSFDGFWETKTNATIRVMNDRGRTEIRTFTRWNGRAVKPGETVTMPFRMDGFATGFARQYFSKWASPCYAFSVLPKPGKGGTLQVAFETLPDRKQRCPDRGQEQKGVAFLDPVTMQIRRLERVVTKPVPGTEVTYTTLEVDYGAVMLGGREFWLPMVVKAEVNHGTGSFQAKYTNYRLYTGTAVILPTVEGSEEVP